MSNQIATYLPNGLRVGNGAKDIQMQNGEGVPMSPLQMFVVNPVNDSSGTYVSSAATTYANNTTVTLNAYNTTNYSVQGQSVVQLDCQRKLKFVASGIVPVGANGVFLISGYDDRGVYIQDQVTFNNTTQIGTVAGIPDNPTSLPLTNNVGLTGNGATWGCLLSLTTGVNAVSAGNSITADVVGYDYFGNTITETITILSNTPNNTKASTYYYYGVTSVTLNSQVVVGGAAVAFASAVTLNATNNGAQIASGSVIAFSNKCFSKVLSIIANPDSAAIPQAFNFKVGVANQIGFPFYIPNIGFIVSLAKNNSNGLTSSLSILQANGTLSTANQALANVAIGYNFYYNGAPTISSTDARGFIISSEGAAMGITSALIYCYGADSWFNAQLTSNNTSTYFPNNSWNVDSSYVPSQYAMDATLAGVAVGSFTPYLQNNGDAQPSGDNPTFDKPQSMGAALGQYDITGVQYPGDIGVLNNQGQLSFPNNAGDNFFGKVFPN